MSKVTILNVEDYASSREGTNELLKGEGFCVVDAVNGTEALELAESVRPQLIILDVKLPDISGYEVCRRLKSNPETAMIPILHVSGVRVADSDKALGLAGGADAYLIKPVEPEELLATVRALLRMGEAEAARLESEARYEVLFEGNSMPAWVFDLETLRFLAVNGAATRHYGYSREQFLGLTILDVWAPEDVPVFEMYLSRIPLGAENAAQWRHITRRGEVINVEVVWHELIFRGRHALLVLAKDVTAQIRAQAEREQLLKSEQQAREQAQEANRAKDEFLALVTHELRAPLNAVLGWANILRTAPINETTVQHAAAVIERSARTQSRLIEDLLDTARIATGKLRLDIQPVNLAAVLENVLDVFLPAAEAKSISMNVSFGSRTEVMTGDPERLQQLFWNLISNAIKFTPNEGRVEVRLERVDPHLRITVSDTGKGISPDSLQSIFDRFQQGESGTRRRSGLGLGLSLVRDLVELHGGTVTADSPGVGLGATFTVDLPVRAVRPAHEYPASDQPAGEHVTLPRRLEGVRVLVVDDEADARDLVATLLQQFGAEATAVGSVAEAMRELTSGWSTGGPTVLISDIGMPVEDGYDLIRRVRQLPAEGAGQIPAIALTAFGRSVDHTRALESGFQVHMAKPVEPAELVAAIARLTTTGNKALSAGKTAEMGVANGNPEI
jgi:PAS domain S-box-containing protein